MSANRRPVGRNDFEIAIICAKIIEVNAVEAMLDEDWESSPTSPSYTKAHGDMNTYTFGRIGSHNVVLANLGGTGTGISASRASSFRSSFARIRLALVVGLCGGVPTITSRGENTEVLLGDVLISTRVVEYTHGTQRPDKFVTKNTLEFNLSRPNQELRGFLQKLETDITYDRLKVDTSANLTALLNKKDPRKYGYPGSSHDKLYEPGHRHKHYTGSCHTCAKCVKDEDEVCVDALNMPCENLGCSQQIPRDRIKDNANIPNPEHLVHLGVVASGDWVMRSGHHRDEIVFEQKVSAFEMEGAGVWDHFPTVVIKGVCDYADSHKNDRWQGYAAARAAACMKALLRLWRPTDTTVWPQLVGTYEPWQFTTKPG